MTFDCLPLFAEVVHRTFEWGRIQDNVDWILPVFACVAAMLFVVYMYLRDAVELNPVLGCLLGCLRCAVWRT